MFNFTFSVFILSYNDTALQSKHHNLIFQSKVILGKSTNTYLGLWCPLDFHFDLYLLENTENFNEAEFTTAPREMASVWVQIYN